MRHRSFLTQTLEHPEGLNPSSHTLPSGAHCEIWDTGVIRFIPAKPKKHLLHDRLLFSCGIHGNETAPIEICDALITQLLAGTLTPSRDTLFIIGNPFAINAGLRQIDYNLNRLFSGAHVNAAHPENTRAANLERMVKRFFESPVHTTRTQSLKLHWDLHTAIRESLRPRFAIYPYLHGAQPDSSHIERLYWCGVDTVVFSHEATTTFSYFTSHCCNADSFTIELGKALPFGTNDLDSFSNVREALASLITATNHTLPQPPSDYFTYYTVYDSMIKYSESFILHLKDTTPNFTTFTPGTLIAEDLAHTWSITGSDQTVLFPNPHVHIGHRVGLLVNKVLWDPVSANT